MHPVLTLVLLLLPAGLQGLQLPGDPPAGVAPEDAGGLLVRLDPLEPDALLDVPGGPRLIHFQAPGTAVAALRLSIPLAESPSEAGAGRVLVLAALARVEPLALRVGARVEGSRTFHGIVYTVSGPSSAFDHLAWLLRELVRDPDEAAVRGAVERLRTSLDGGRETPAGVLDTRLREGVSPSLPPLSGSPASLTGLSPDRVRGLWSRTHVRERMTVVASAPVPVEVLLAGVLDAGVPEGLGGPAVEQSLPPSTERARTQVLRSWYGEAYVVEMADDPRSAVAARLMAERLRTLPGRVEAGVQLWELGGRAALVVTGAAYPTDAAAMRRTIQGIREDVLSAADPATIARIVGELRSETLLGARSGPGLVSVVGYHLDATGDPAGARTFLEALNRVDGATMSSFLSELRARTPVTADVRP